MGCCLTKPPSCPYKPTTTIIPEEVRSGDLASQFDKVQLYLLIVLLYKTICFSPLGRGWKHLFHLQCLINSPCFIFSFFRTFIETSRFFFSFYKACKPSACIWCCSQPSLSAVRRVQQGEWSNVNQDCYSTDYNARPSICLPLCLTLPPASQDAQIILLLDICLYLYLPSTPAFPRWPANPCTHAFSLSLPLKETLMNAACTPAHKKHSPGEWKARNKNILKALAVLGTGRS